METRGKHFEESTGAYRELSSLLSLCTLMPPGADDLALMALTLITDPTSDHLIRVHQNATAAAPVATLDEDHQMNRIMSTRAIGRCLMEGFATSWFDRQRPEATTLIDPLPLVGVGVGIGVGVGVDQGGGRCTMTTTTWSAWPPGQVVNRGGGKRGGCSGGCPPGGDGPGRAWI